MTVGVIDARITKLKLEIKRNRLVTAMTETPFTTDQIRSKIIQYEVTVRLFWLWPNHLSLMCCKRPSWWKYSVRNHSGTGLFWVQPKLYIAIGLIANTLHPAPKYWYNSKHLASCSKIIIIILTCAYPHSPPPILFSKPCIAHKDSSLWTVTLFSQPCTAKTKKVLGSSSASCRRGQTASVLHAVLKLVWCCVYWWLRGWLWVSGNNDQVMLSSTDGNGAHLLLMRKVRCSLLRNAELLYVTSCLKRHKKTKNPFIQP